MAVFKYKPFYEYSGPTRSDPFRERLSDEQIHQNMQAFYNHLEDEFSNTDALFETDSTGTVSIITLVLSEKDCDEIMKRHLNSLDFFANKVREPQC